MIYFVTAREIGRVKIGFSDNPLSRFAKMKTDSPARLVLERIAPGGMECERHIHALFSTHRVGGEWFALCDEIEAHMAALDEPAPADNKKASDRNFQITGGGFVFDESRPAFENLSELLVWEGVSRAAFADRIGMDRGNLTKLLGGKIRPTLDMAFKIEGETNGAVTARAFAQQDAAA